MAVDDTAAVFALMNRKPPAAPEQAPVPRQTVAKKPEPKAPDAPIDVVKLARARLKVVSAEVKTLRRQLKKLEREQAQLTRLLDAADGKTKATVTPIRGARQA